MEIDNFVTLSYDGWRENGEVDKMNNHQVHQITLQCTSVCVEVEPARRNDGGIVKADSIYWTRVKFGETISIESNHLPVLLFPLVCTGNTEHKN